LLGQGYAAPDIAIGAGIGDVLEVTSNAARAAFSPVDAMAIMFALIGSISAGGAGLASQLGLDHLGKAQSALLRHRVGQFAVLHLAKGLGAFVAESVLPKSTLRDSASICRSNRASNFWAASWICALVGWAGAD
jgi:uncharacterized membrane protein